MRVWYEAGYYYAQCECGHIQRIHREQYDGNAQIWCDECGETGFGE